MKITKALRKQFEEKARELVAAFNPYIKESIKYYIAMKPMFLWRDKQYTKEEIDNAYYETALKHIENGFKERMVGSYDKYYRYTYADEGKAYDAGQEMATKHPKCPKECFIIEIAECNR